MKTRFLLAEQVTATLLQRSIWVYSPIVHCHELAQKHTLPTTFEYWQQYNIDMLRRCDELCVIDIPGWRESKGVTGELTIARALHMNIAMISPEGEWSQWLG